MGIGDDGCCGFGRVLAGLGRGDGALWVGCGELTLVGSLQRGRGRGEGVRARSPFPSMSHGLGRGWGVWGSTAGRQGTLWEGHGRIRGVSPLLANSASILFDFCPQRVRSNARKKFKFEFLKTATVGLHHIGQGFQGYFCFEEITSFAKIYISNLGIVTVSDSKFG
jgi:hypothetical protein